MTYVKKTFLQASNPDLTSSSQRDLITSYQTALQQGNFQQAQSIIRQITNGIESNMNAGRFNVVLEVVESLEDFLLGNEFKQYIKDNVNAYNDFDFYSNLINYNIGNIACDSQSLQWFKCIQANGPSTSVKPLTNTSYWQPFLTQQNAKQYAVTSDATPPATVQVGELWFHITGTQQ